MAYDYELLSIGCGPAGQRAAIQTAKLGRRVAVVERPQPRRRRLHEHRHRPVEDAARRRARPDRAAAEGHVRRRLPRQDEITIEDLFWRTQPRDRARDRGDPRPAVAATTSISSRAPRASSTSTRSTSVPSGGNRRVTAEHIVIAVGTTPVQPARRRVRRAHGARLRQHPPARADPPRTLTVVGARRDRHRVRLDVRRARRARDAGRAAPARLLTSSTPRSSRRCSTTCASSRVVAPARRRRSTAVSGTTTAAPSRSSRAASRSPPTSALYAAGRQGATDALSSRTPGSRPTRAAASRSTSATAPRSRTSTPSAT